MNRSRLGCQIEMCKDLDGITVRIPSATRNLRVDGMYCLKMEVYIYICIYLHVVYRIQANSSLNVIIKQYLSIHRNSSLQISGPCFTTFFDLYCRVQHFIGNGIEYRQRIPTLDTYEWMIVWEFAVLIRFDTVDVH